MPKNKEFTVVGKSIPAKDAKAKVTGSLKYASDFELPGMVHGKILRSQHPRAIIKKIKTSKAEALVGVVGVVTHEDAPDWDWHGVWLNYIGPILDGKPRFFGDEIGAVAATSQEIAEAALELIEVEYEVLPAVFDPEEAMAEDAPLIHSRKNARTPNKWEWGDLKQGEEESDFIVEEDVKFGSQQYAPIGRNAAIAQWEGDRVTLWTSTQTPSELQDGVARGFGIDQSKVRIVALPTGCSFGLWWTNNFMLVTALLAKKVKKPVKIELTNQECMAMVKRRHKERTRGRMGCTKDGKITFIDVYHIMDNGGYGFKVEVGYFNIDMWGGRAPHGRYVCQGVSTNLVTAGCMRGVGDVTMGSVVERLADRLAKKVNMDPLEFRILNQIKPGDPLRQRWASTHVKGDRTAYRQRIPKELKDVWPELFQLSTGSTEEILIKGAEAFGWKDKWAGWGKPYQINRSKRRAVGVGTGIHICGEEMEGNTSAVVRVFKDGSAKIFCSIGRHGTGAETTQSQIAAEALGIPIDRIQFETGDSDSCPWSRGSIASTTTFRTGYATWSACQDAKRQILAIAGRDIFETDPSKLDIKDGLVFSPDHPGKEVPISEVIMHFRAEALSPSDSITGRSALPMPPSTAFARHFAAHFADLEVDIETGQIKLLDYLAAQDSGTVVNPKILENQIIGGAMVGAGFALSEVLVFDDNGRILNPNLTDYKVLRMVDFPVEAKMLFHESYEPSGPFGAKSAGEAPIAAAPPAVCQAVYNAIGVWVDVPMTPEKVLRALGRI
jgi:xanthine dehydrogenase molybdenum-binding subunit